MGPVSDAHQEARRAATKQEGLWRRVYGGMAMTRREPLILDQRRLLRITARMPLASVGNLAAASGATEDRVRAMLGRLRSGSSVESRWCGA